NTINYVRVTLFDISDDLADDVNFVLVAPNGITSFVLMADAGGSNAITAGTTLTFNDNSASFLPDSTAFGSGSYKPTSHSAVPSVFPFLVPPTATAEPGPGGGRSAFMNTTFGGMNANGTWTLWVYDDSGTLAPLAPGIVAGGW